MNKTDPKLTALQFNEYINRQDVNRLSNMMTENHKFIDRAGGGAKGKKEMTPGWIRFFKDHPEYTNTFKRVESKGNLVTLYGYATWEIGDDPDYSIWTAMVENDLVVEWRIYENTVENRKKFNLI